MLTIKSIGSEFKKAVDKKTVGKIFLISRRALLIDLNGVIFEILSLKMPKSTISAIVSKDELNDLPLAVGNPVVCGKNILLNGVDLELDSAEIWVWDLEKRKFNLPKDDLMEILHIIRNVLNHHLSSLLIGTKDPLLRATINKIHHNFNLCEISLEKDPVRIARILLDLVGVGPGLTPAGDDALAGFLTGSYQFAHPKSQLFKLVNILRNEIGCKMTTAYSKRLLNLAASGISNEYVRELILSIHDQNFHDLVRNAKKILGLGATSGYFYLFGFAKGLEMVSH